MPEVIDQGLGRDEASLVARWLTDNGKAVKNGYLSVWRLTPGEVATRFGVEELEVKKAARRVVSDYPTDYSYEK